jgi:hypothetical protein
MGAALKRSFRRCLASLSEVSGKTTLGSASRKLTTVKSLELEMNLETARSD